ncbi:uncharacterized protein LOC131143908 [Malania oleifera]|uniref:uncharacterized protein LOC131143908 n=1 Tax=Malania oleifera TaxID=397392 RepID=UPI0025AE348F|nr:uncharacterized protein LOC131143908 [Malania oleifera]
MAANAARRRKILQRKLHMLRTPPTISKSENSSITMDASLDIFHLKLQLEAIRTQYLNLLKHLHVPKEDEVKVEKMGNGFSVKVTSGKGRDLLVPILEAFEELGLNVLHANVSCDYSFVMEAVVEAQNQALDVREVTTAVLEAVGDP